MSHFLGFDFSTQKLKAVVIDERLDIIHESEVHFDRQLPEFRFRRTSDGHRQVPFQSPRTTGREYLRPILTPDLQGDRTQGGAVKGENGVVTVPVILWIKALDLLLDQMKLDGVDFSKVKALSGAAQQHGSVYWQKNTRDRLQNLDSSQFLHQQLQTCFSLKHSPIWMDSSTSDYCRQIEEAVGGPENLAEITGSRAFERFTGAQIAKLADQRPSVYENTERISLISSFACSLFLGDYANLDYADASGMNLMDIRTMDWHESCVKATKAPDLEEKLGKPVPPRSVLGYISKYYVERFGFCSDCQVVCFTGDNPASLAGMRLSGNDVAVSLGTSDTVILFLPEPKVFINGHVMKSPTDADGFIGLLCFKNGSLTRERVRNFYANGSWEEFNKLLDSTPRGNFGNIGLYFDSQEILPNVKKGEYRWNARGEKVVKFASAEIEVRALIEGQFLARRSHAEDLGLFSKADSKIIATGGASRNKAILQVLADVFNTPVYVQKSENSVALGSAYLAKISVENLSFESILEQLSELQLICSPNKDSSQIYDPMLKKYRILTDSLVNPKANT